MTTPAPPTGDLMDIVTALQARVATLEQRITSPYFTVPAGSSPTFQSVTIGEWSGRNPAIDPTTNIPLAMNVSAPTNLTLTPITTLDDVAINASWVAPVDGTAQNFLVTVAQKHPDGTYTLHDSISTAGTNVHISGLTPNTTYGVTVASINAIGVVSGAYPASGYVDATTVPDSTIPVGVTGLAISAGATSIMLTWNENTEPDVAQGNGLYEIEWANNSALTGSTLTRTTATLASFVGLSPSNTYYFRVRAYDASGNPGPWSGVVSATPGTVGGGGAPSDGLAPASSPTPTLTSGVGPVIVVKYPMISNADAVTYDVHISTISGFTPTASTLAATSPASDVILFRDGANAALVYGTPYYVKIVARDADGSAAPSAEATITPQRIDATNLMPGTIDMSMFNTGTQNNVLNAQAALTQVILNPDFKVASADGTTPAFWSLGSGSVWHNDATGYWVTMTVPGGSGFMDVAQSTRQPVRAGDRIVVRIRYRQTAGTAKSPTLRFNWMDTLNAAENYDGVHHKFDDAINENWSPAPTANAWVDQIVYLTVPSGMNWVRAEFYGGEWTTPDTRIYEVTSLRAVVGDPVADAANTAANNAQTAANNAQTAAANAQTSANNAQTAANNAQSAANAAQTTANGRNRVFYQATPPTATATNDLWFDTSNGYRMSQWNGSSWVLFSLGDAALGAIAAAKLTGTITSTQISDNSISTPKLQAGSVTTAVLAAGAVTAGQIAAGTITATQIAAQTITAAQIATGTITAGQIAAGTITATQIQAATITGAQIAAGTITANNMVAGTITAASGIIGSLDAAVITTGTLNAARLAAGSITATLLATGAVTADKIQANTITADKLTIGSISNNLVRNSGMEDVDASGTWVASWNKGFPSGDGVTVSGGGPADFQSDTISLSGSRSMAIAGYTVGHYAISSPIPVTPGDTLALHYSYQVSAPVISGLYLRATFYNKPNPNSFGDGMVADTPTSLENTAEPSANVWRTRDDQVTVPAGATHLILRPHAWFFDTDAWVRYDTVEVRKVVISAQIANGAISTPQLAAGAITAASGIIASLDATTITTGLLNASRIGANSITVDKLSVGSAGQGMILNPNLQDPGAGDNNTVSGGGAAGWSATDTTVGNPPYMQTQAFSAFNGIPGSRYMVMHGSPTMYSGVQSNATPCQGGQKYYIEALLQATIASTQGLNLRVWWYDSRKDAGYLGFADVVSNAGVGAAVTKLGAQGIAPANASYMRVGLYWYYPNVDSYLIIGSINSWLVADSVQIADGAISATKILGGTVTSDHINATVGLDAALIKFNTMSGDRITANTLDIGAIKSSTLSAKTITLASDGQIIGGSNPLGVSPTGFVLNGSALTVYYAGSTKMRLDFTNGNATFSGDITGSSGTFSGTVSGGIISGGTINGTNIYGSVFASSSNLVAGNGIAGIKIDPSANGGSVFFYSNNATQNSPAQIYGGSGFFGSGLSLTSGSYSGSGNSTLWINAGNPPRIWAISSFTVYPISGVTTTFEVGTTSTQVASNLYGAVTIGTPTMLANLSVNGSIYLGGAVLGGGNTISNVILATATLSSPTINSPTITGLSAATPSFNSGGTWTGGPTISNATLNNGYTLSGGGSIGGTVSGGMTITGGMSLSGGLNLNAGTISGGGSWTGGPTINNLTGTSPSFSSGGSWTGSPTIGNPSISNFATTASGTANVIMGTGGAFTRITSTMRSKWDIEDLALSDAMKVLDMRAVTFHGNGDLSTDPKGWGYLGEEVLALGLRSLVWMEGDRVEYVNYDRVPVAHNLILRSHEGRIGTLESYAADDILTLRELQREVKELRALLAHQ